MKLCLVTHGTFLDPARIASGNSVRAYYTARALVERGVEVVHLHPAELERHATPGLQVPQGVTVASYRDGPDLLRRIARERPTAVLVGYWELLEHFPESYEYPIVVDVVAPRILESLFEDRDLSAEVRRLVELYRRADLFIAGNERQRHFLAPWLILAGFRCAAGIPASVIPISTDLDAAGERPRREGPWRFVSGGVTWPWRRTAAYFDPLFATLGEGPATLDLFAGSYVYASVAADGAGRAGAEAAGAERVKIRPLLPYGAMQAFLRTSCDVGVELAEYNLEREFSQSFRSAEFLRHGLPLLCNRYVELADLVAEYDAGWLVGAPAEVPAALREIFASPERWEAKSRNARRLVAERLHYARTIEPLLAFLRDPRRPERGPRPVLDAAAAPRRGAAASAPGGGAPSREPMRRRLRRALASFVQRRLPRSDAIAIVTRGDVFPTDHGAAVKIDRTARALAADVSAVYLVTDDRERYHRYAAGGREARRYPWLVRKLAPSRAKARGRVVAAGVPPDDAFLYEARFDWSFVVRTLWVALRHGVRRFQAEFPAYAIPCLRARRLVGGVTAIVEHNVEYVRLADQHAELDPGARAWLRDLEIRACNRVDLVVTVSELDRERLVRDGVPADKVRVIPHGVDLSGFAASARLDVRGRLELPRDCALLVYHGVYGYPPNLDAIRFLASEILPRVNARGFRPRVLALGPLPPASSPHADVIFTGSVPDVAPYLLDADIAVVPLRMGGGTRMKVLDYFAAGLPVVSSAKGVEGLGLVNGTQAIIEDDPEAFAAAVADLLGAPARRAALGEAGRRHVAGLDWSRIAERYLAEYRACEAGGGAGLAPRSEAQAGPAGEEVNRC